MMPFDRSIAWTCQLDVPDHPPALDDLTAHGISIFRVTSSDLVRAGTFLLCRSEPPGEGEAGVVLLDRLDSILGAVVGGQFYAVSGTRLHVDAAAVFRVIGSMPPRR